MKPALLNKIQSKLALLMIKKSRKRLKKKNKKTRSSQKKKLLKHKKKVQQNKEDEKKMWERLRKIKKEFKDVNPITTGLLRGRMLGETK